MSALKIGRESNIYHPNEIGINLKSYLQFLSDYLRSYSARHAELSDEHWTLLLKEVVQRWVLTEPMNFYVHIATAYLEVSSFSHKYTMNYLGGLIYMIKIDLSLSVLQVSRAEKSQFHSGICNI